VTKATGPANRRSRQRLAAAWIAFASTVAGMPAPALAAGDDIDRFRATYRELVETDTSLSNGSCTKAADLMRTRLLAAGFPARDTRVVVAPAFPRQGNLVASLAGSDPQAPALLLLAHIDVVEAKASDWKRDPFKLVEENGYFYGRGAIDDKAMAAAFVDAMVRFREEGFKPRRTIKLALTCGEETDDVFNGLQYLIANEPQSVAAGLAINEGGKGYLDDAGKPVTYSVQAGEKTYQDFKLVTTSPGGHSARPGKDNAITRLSAALVRVGAFTFPTDLLPVTRNFFAESAALHKGQTQADMRAIGAGTADAAAFTRISDTDKVWNASLRTTCVATQLAGGHAPNALPQRAEATVNCRILPGQRVADVQRTLVTTVADASVAVTLVGAASPVSPPPPMTPAVMDPIKQIVGEMWPGVPVIPSLTVSATDGRFANAAGVPTYGNSGIFVDPDGNGVHGLDERVRVKSLLDGRAFLYRLTKAYASQGR
jgi:acetylornithine deacetylase/succinyl-diaminopimelate desuccinylase-like protein